MDNRYADALDALMFNRMHDNYFDQTQTHERRDGMNSKHTPGPWISLPRQDRRSPIEIRTDEVLAGAEHGRLIAKLVNIRFGEDAANAALIAAAPDLLVEARLLHCLASSPRFQSMTVADALAELALNGCGHDNGAAIAKAEGQQ